MLRAVFKRPQFLPPAVELSTTSWFFLSHLYTASIWKQVDVREPLILMVQVSGQVDVQVQAWRRCDDLCPVLHHTLSAGQILVVTELLWKVSYLPSPDSDNLGIGLGSSF